MKSIKSKVVKTLAFTKISKKELNDLIEIPKDPNLGDYAFPCFLLSKEFKKNPAEIAKEIVEKIKKNDTLEKIEAVNGYVNFFVDRKKLAEKVIKKIEKEKERYGSDKKKKENVMVEFSQPNTHKAFHVGHIRGTSLGESLARIIEFSGNKVIRANYSGDTGMHIAKWLWCYMKYHSKEELREDESWIANIYVDAIKRLEDNEKLQEEVDEINKKLDEKKDKKLMSLWKITRRLSTKSWKRIYHELNTEFDVHFFESEMEKRGKEIAQELVRKKIAEISDEATIVDLKKYGLEVWVLLRKDGTVLYSAKDLALAEKKFKEFKINRSIYVVGSEQKLHFYQLFKTLELMKFKQAKKCKYIPVSLIRLPWGKMSSRTGDNFLYSELKKKVVEETVKEIEKRYNLDNTELYNRALAISLSAIKYSMLKQDIKKEMIFNPKEEIKFEGNTGPYLLYSYARAKSILRKAKIKSKLEIREINEHEKRMINILFAFPEIVKKSYDSLAPNLIANYSYELAKTFSDFYHNCPVLNSKEEKFRLALVSCFAQVMKNSLALLGINVVEKM